jgi:hypothetical protein
MNNYITYCARAKFNRLIESTPGCCAIALKADRLWGGFEIEFLFTDVSISDIMISNSPKVFTDIPTLQLMKEASVDFNYDSGEFIITKDSNVVPAIA